MGWMGSDAWVTDCSRDSQCRLLFHGNSYGVVSAAPVLSLDGGQIAAWQRFNFLGRTGRLIYDFR